MIIDNFTFKIDNSDFDDIYTHLKIVDKSFNPRLSTILNLKEYARKISNLSVKFECWETSNLIGLIAMYNNFDEMPFSYITNVSVFEVYSGRKIASQLLTNAIDFAKMKRISRIDLHVNKFNIKAINFYKKNRFEFKSEVDSKILMSFTF